MAIPSARVFQLGNSAAWLRLPGNLWLAGTPLGPLHMALPPPVRRARRRGAFPWSETGPGCARLQG